MAALVLCPAAVSAQPETGFDTSKQWKIEQLGKNHVKLTGAVEAQRGDTKFFADEIESWTDTNRVVATGNVTFSQGGAQISADRADFNTETKLGTFFNATGFASLTSEPKRDMLGGQDADMYFYGDEIEKIGDKKYKIRHGGFTTCLQPTPRWQVTSGTVILHLDHYAYLTNAMLKAKSLPVFYFPVLYYPINKEDRATGFLMPAYGTSTYRGFTLSNAFFWALGRSHDATFMHDWFSKRGYGAGTEYRYVLGPGSQGFFRFYKLNEHESTTNGQTVPASTSYEVRGNATYALGGGWSARGRADYFTSLQAQQLYHTNIYDASRSQRTISGGVSGMLLGLGVNAAYDRSEYFNGPTNSALTGNSPRINVSRGDRPLFGSIVYFSVTGEYADLLRQYKNGDAVTDNGLRRMEVAPVVRVPFTKLRWVTVNSSATWHGTYWTKSYDASNAIVAQPITRSFFDLQSRITGPVFNRVWNTPDNGYAEKWKHPVEPFLNLQRVTMVDNFDQIVKLDGLDYTVGGTTRIDYGVNNRMLAKRKGGPAGGSARDIVSVGITQTYYTNAAASQYDYNYSTSFTSRPPSNFSPIRLAATFSPNERINGTMRAEYDHQAGILQSISASGQAAVGDWLSFNAGYSQRKLKQNINQVPAYVNDNFLNANVNLRTSSNRVGGMYTFNYDIGRSTLLTSRIVTYYNAQCCGVAFEYQTYNFPGNYLGINKDRRFNFSFTLAGLGTFSNFFGALGGVTR
jgi:LPS-assembly protein